MDRSIYLNNEKNVKYNYYNKRYEEILKNNNNQRIIEKYNAFCNEEIKEKTILYETFHGKSMTDNPYAIFKAIQKKIEFEDYMHVWVINTHSIETDRFKNCSNIRFVKVNSDEYLYYLARAKYLINNTSFPQYFCKRNEQIYVNTWHGTPLKTLGIDMNGPIEQLKNLQRNFLQSDYILSPNSYTTEKLVKSHNLDGIYSGEVLEVGYPRIDLINNTNKIDITKKLKSYVHIQENKKIALYAPTWRGNVGKETDIKKKVKTIISNIQENLDSEYQLLLKVHPLLYKYFKDDKELSNLFIPDSIDVNETLSIVDLLITDYSSIFFDFYIKNKPIILYIYDKEEYLSDRGTYLEFSDLNCYVAENKDELNKLIKRPSKLKRCKIDSYVSLQNGFVSDTVVDLIFNNEKSKYSISYKNTKRNILFFVDDLLDYSFDKKIKYINENFDRAKFNIIILVKSNLTFEEEMQINKLKDIKIFFRFGNLNASKKNWIEYMIAMDIGSIKNNEILLNELSKKEIGRLLGNLNIHQIYNFSSNTFWQVILGFYPNTKKTQFLDMKLLKKFNEDPNYYYKSFIRKFDEHISFNIESLKIQKENPELNIEYLNINLLDLNFTEKIQLVEKDSFLVQLEDVNQKERFAFIKTMKLSDKFIFIDAMNITLEEVLNFYNLIRGKKYFDTFNIYIYGLDIQNLKIFEENYLLEKDQLIPVFYNSADRIYISKFAEYIFVLEDFKYSMDKIYQLYHHNINVLVTDKSNLLNLIFKDHLSIYEWRTFLPLIEKYNIKSIIDGDERIDRTK